MEGVEAVTGELPAPLRPDRGATSAGGSVVSDVHGDMAEAPAPALLQGDGKAPVESSPEFKVGSHRHASLSDDAVKVDLDLDADIPWIPPATSGTQSSSDSNQTGTGSAAGTQSPDAAIHKHRRSSSFSGVTELGPADDDAKGERDRPHSASLNDTKHDSDSDSEIGRRGRVMADGLKKSVTFHDSVESQTDTVIDDRAFCGRASRQYRQLSADVVYTAFVEFIERGKPCRMFVREGLFTHRKMMFTSRKQFVLHLFSDLICFSEKDRRGYLRQVDKFHLRDCTVSPCVSDESPSLAITHVPSRKTICVSANHVHVRDQWCNDIHMLVEWCRNGETGIMPVIRSPQLEVAFAASNSRSISSSLRNDLISRAAAVVPANTSSGGGGGGHARSHSADVPEPHYKQLARSVSQLTSELRPRWRRRQDSSGPVPAPAIAPAAPVPAAPAPAAPSAAPAPAAPAPVAEQPESDADTDADTGDDEAMDSNSQDLGVIPKSPLSKRYEMTWAYAIDQMKLVKSAMKQRNAGDYDRMDKEIQALRERREAAMSARVAHIKKGDFLYKYDRQGQAYLRFYKVDAAGETLSWSKHGGPSSNDHSIDLASIAQIVIGPQTRRFRRYKKEGRGTPWLCFSLIPYDSSSATVDIECGTVEQLDCWVLGLQSLIPLWQSTHITHGQLLWIRTMIKADYLAQKRGLGTRSELFQRLEVQPIPPPTSRTKTTFDPRAVPSGYLGLSSKRILSMSSSSASLMNRTRTLSNSLQNHEPIPE
ncbi:PH domain-containing protein [Plasmodiophora brassicae]